MARNSEPQTVLQARFNPESGYHDGHRLGVSGNRRCHLAVPVLDDNPEVHPDGSSDARLMLSHHMPRGRRQTLLNVIVRTVTPFLTLPQIDDLPWMSENTYACQSLVRRESSAIYAWGCLTGTIMHNREKPVRYGEEKVAA